MAKKGPQIKMIPVTPKAPLGNMAKAFTLMFNAVRDQVVEGVRFMSVYPAQGVSKYRRTGTLRRSWFFKLASGGGRIEGTIASNRNIAPYNESVQGANQTDLFKTRGWHSTEQLEKEIEKDFARRMQKAINEAY